MQLNEQTKPNQTNQKDHPSLYSLQLLMNKIKIVNWYKMQKKNQIVFVFHSFFFFLFTCFIYFS